MSERRRFGIVLSGGGARGAYEVGVLAWLLEELPRRLGRPPRIDVFTGTSVGAIHACWLAASLDEPDAGPRLEAIWRSLEVAGVYRMGLRDLLAIPRRALGLGSAEPTPRTDRLSGILDTRPLERLVRETVAWDRLRTRVACGDVEAVAVAATEIATGRSVVWVDRREPTTPVWPNDPFVVARPAALTPEHALASAAIPFLFPALRVDGEFFCDGGLRLNTPLAPALRLGCDRLLVIGLRHVPTPAEDAALAAARTANYASLTYLTGKMLNALLLDRIDYDVDRLQLTNAVLEAGVRTYGAGFLAHVNETVERVRGAPYRVVDTVYLRPSQDLGVLAAECYAHKERPESLRAWISDAVLRYAVQGLVAEADLLSYLLFDGCYASHLITLGRADAARRADELVALFADQAPPP
ncbi:MAG: patatin-like phospholipase family protein [bacterium]|nr:patatin-like phospholipase family protein [bacterium]